MKRKTASFPVQNIDVIKQQMLNWVNRFGICSFLDNHQYNTGQPSVECLAAAGAIDYFTTEIKVLPQLKKFCKEQNDWLFGHIGYDLKNETEGLVSSHDDHIGFPLVYFFRPRLFFNYKIINSALHLLLKSLYLFIIKSALKNSKLQTPSRYNRDKPYQ